MTRMTFTSETLAERREDPEPGFPQILHTLSFQVTPHGVYIPITTLLLRRYDQRSANFKPYRQRQGGLLRHWYVIAATRFIGLRRSLDYSIITHLFTIVGRPTGRTIYLISGTKLRTTVLYFMDRPDE